MTIVSGSFPMTRLRRQRMYPWLRDVHQETALTPQDFIWPVFIREPQGDAIIKSLPGVKRHTKEELIPAVEEALSLGIKAIALFPQTNPSLKTPEGEEAWNPENLVCQAIRHLKKHCPEMGLIADVALDPYTDHGHDGVLSGDKVLNDPTIDALTRQSLTLAQAGVDVLAPSDMMDGRIGALRRALDQASFSDLPIFSYSAKYASTLYGPFREAAGSKASLKGGSKATYQMNPANAKEALLEMALDVEEGADALIVKPGTFYLDIIKKAAETFHMPIHGYHVSGEYSMLKAADAAGYLSYNETLLENLLAFKRAGASAIWTYGAIDAARLL
jgi:porphobilinogen synthase